MKILGISAHYHDSAAALVVDGMPVCAVQEERLSRRKNDAAFPLAPSNGAWTRRARAGGSRRGGVLRAQHAEIRPDPDLRVAGLSPLLALVSACHEELARRKGLGARHHLVPSGRAANEDPVHRPPPRRMPPRLPHRADAPRRDPDRRRRGRMGDADGRARRAAPGAATDITLLREIRFPHSLGMLYSTFTAYLGFAVNEDEYKVMGLAAYGRPTMADAVRKLIRRTPDGAFALDLDYFEYHTTARRSYSQRFVDLFGPPRNPYEPIDLDTRGRPALRRLRRQRPARARGHAGGHRRGRCIGRPACRTCAWAAAWRSTASPMRGSSPSPASSACSSRRRPATPAARWARRSMPIASISAIPDRDVPDHPFWGPAVDGEELARAAREDGQPVEELDEAALIERVADDLAAGRIVGWMDGASEFGPRALGHRSILAAPHSARDARPAQSRHQVSRGVPAVRAGRARSRRPNAISICRRAARGWRRFMSGVFPVRPEWRSRLAAITHVDGSARLQALERGMAPRLYALLEAYGRRSGIPVLLNTSFNVAGEPIVNRAVEGYSTFRRCGIDVLVAGPTLVTKRASPADRVKEEVA